VFIDLGIQHVMLMSHVAISDLPGSSMFFHIISQMTQFLRKSY